MPDHVLAGPGFVLLFAVLVFMLVQVLRNEDGPPPPPIENAPPGIASAKIFHLPSGMSSSAGFKAWWTRRFSQRAAYGSEVLFDIEDDGSIVISFPMPRRPTRIDARFNTDQPLLMKDVKIETAEDHQLPEWTGKWFNHGGKQCLRLEFDGKIPLTAIRLTPTVTGREDECRVWVNKNGNPDAKHIEFADQAEREGNVQSLEWNLRTYQDMCPGNPVPALRLAHLYRHTNELEKAEIQALRAIAGNRAELGAHFCRELAVGREWGLTDERLAELRTEAANWDLEGHHGLVTLVNDRDFLTGPGNFLRERHVSAILVRRRAAARKFRSVSLPMVAGWGGQLHTAARVRRVDGSVDELSDDRFTVGSADDDNPFIAIARRSVGNWILPDLSPGDVVEYTCDKVKLGQVRLFTLANLADPHCPTLHGKVSFTSSPDMDIVYALRNTEPGNETGQDEATGWNRITLAREKVVPRRSHSDPYQLNALNPVVAFANSADGWDDMGGKLLKDYYEAVDAAEKIPERLAAAYADAPDTPTKLARAFYWVRDHIKYASVASHHEVLLSPERADFVIESGMGDCKDVSYLLALVCRDLDVPWEFVLTSTENGIIIEELPADQFDHVILRAKLDGDWLYMDASASEAIFGAPPPTAQDLPALAGRDPFELVTMPVVPADFNRVTIRQSLAGIDDGWLHGDMDVRLEGYAARYLDEMWKHQSLTAVDPDRAADDTVRALLPGFLIDKAERLKDTSDSETLHLTATGRHARLVELDGSRIASFGFTAPGMMAEDDGRQRFQERYLFPFRMRVEYELLVGEELRGVIRAVSRVGDLELPMCTVKEERGAAGAEVALRREIVLGKREVDGGDLEQLPELFNRLGAATRVVVGVGGGR